VRITAPCRVSSHKTLAPSLVRRSPHALRHVDAGFRVFTLWAPRKTKSLFFGAPLLGFGPSSEDPSTEPLPRGHSLPQAPDARHNPGRPQAAPPLRFPTPSASSSPGAAASWSSLPRSTACAFRFSQPPGALIRPELTGLVSCRIRSWGQPFKAFFLSRSRTLFPAPFPSWRSDRLQGFTPRESPPLDPTV